MTILTIPVERKPKRPRIPKQIHAIIARDGMHCHWCDQLCKWGKRNSDLFPTREHLIRKADGGTNDMSNMVLACRKCNNTRHHGRYGIEPPATPVGYALLLIQELPAISLAAGSPKRKTTTP